jgi:hypothetical protein
MIIKRREREAVLQALQAGLVPSQGLHLIQVGRKAEVSALIADLNPDRGGRCSVPDSGRTVRVRQNLFFKVGPQPRFSKKPRGRTSRFHHGTPALFDGWAWTRTVQRTHPQPFLQSSTRRRGASGRPGRLDIKNTARSYERPAATRPRSTSGWRLICETSRAW